MPTQSSLNNFPQITMYYLFVTSALLPRGRKHWTKYFRLEIEMDVSHEIGGCTGSWLPTNHAPSDLFIFKLTMNLSDLSSTIPHPCGFDKNVERTQPIAHGS